MRRQLNKFFWLFFLTTMLLSPSLFLAAQPPEDSGLARAGKQLSQIDRLETIRLNHAELIQRDRARPRPGPFRFAEPIPVQVTHQNRGTWEAMPNNRGVWRFRIHSPGAKSINLGFSRYVMPKGGTLFLYSPDYSVIRGPFTEADNEIHQELWTPLISGDEVVIEVSVPQGSEHELQLDLASINHGYQELIKGGGGELDCMLDVACSEADPWREEVRSAGVYTIDGTWTCSGAAINNTSEDATPYFLTAFHCDVDVDSAPSVVVYWNYENSTCREVGTSTNGEPGDGSLDQFSTGAIFRAGNQATDFTLFELDDPIDPSFMVHFSGWNRGSEAASSAVGIHHPRTMEKRISFENGPVTITDSSGGSGDTFIRVADWDVGSTTGGSSGSPLFDSNRRIIGQLLGGFAACGNDFEDYYGRFFKSWTGGGANATRLSNWLDPEGTGDAAIDGITFCEPPSTGNWMVGKDCTLLGNKRSNGNVTIESPWTLTLDKGAVLNLDFVSNFLKVKNGAKVIVRNTAKIEST